MVLFDKDMWQEVFFTINSKRRRSILTMFGIFWGIFMLIVLIGCGFGMKKGVIGDLLSLSNNSVVLMPQPTSMPYNGLQPDRTWHFEDKDVDAIALKMGSRLRYVTKASIEGVLRVASSAYSGVYHVFSVTETYLYDIPQEVVYGRYFNSADIREHRKVCLLGLRLARELFPSLENPCGEYVRLADGMYLIVGVVNQPNQNIALENVFAHDICFLPFTTGQDVFGHHNEIGVVSVCLTGEYDITPAIAEMEEIIRLRHNIHPLDKAYINKICMKDAIEVFATTMSGIELLIFIVGLGTLLAGLIGISNIMLVTIKERTHEIGVRRALGAQPHVIILQIMAEALTLTLIAGLLGIIVGTWSLGLLHAVMNSGGSRGSLLVRPMIPLGYALDSLAILTIGGLVAGYIPARKALKIKAIEALNDNM